MTDTHIDYRTLRNELNTIITELEHSQLDIDEAMKQYERGSKIIKQLETYLSEAETKVTKIKAAWEAALPKEKE